MKYKLLLVYIFFSLNGYAQYEDNVWLFGSSSVDGLFDGYYYGNTTFNFSDIEPSIDYNSVISMDFSGTNASICDPEGNLLFYSNGMYVQDIDGNTIMNGDTIGYSEFWKATVFEGVLPSGDDWLPGYKALQSYVIIPCGDRYYIIYHIKSLDPNKPDNNTRSLAYSVVEKVGNSNHGIIAKDVIIKEDDFDFGQNHPCRHANGRDWWLIKKNREADSTFVFLIDPSGISLHQSFSSPLRTPPYGSFSQADFNADGSKYALAEGQYDGNNFFSVTSLYNFDRCNGNLELISRDTITLDALNGVVAFSPSGRYLYTSTHLTMYQYDTWMDDWKSSRRIVAEYDGFVFKYHDTSPEFPTHLGPSLVGPDGRLYSVHSGSNRYINVMEYPDEEGEDSNMIQHKINIPTVNSISVPNLPDFHLGPIDGSDCDTLDIDNHPIARFRYEVDSLDFLNVRFTDLSYFQPDNWYWDFGDGTTFSGKKPYYHEFPEQGEYTVCLIASNENSEDQFCRTLQLGTTSSSQISLSSKDVMFYPNPVQSEFYIDLKGYVPADGVLTIVDETGRMVKGEKLKSGWNSYNGNELPPGLYFYTIKDQGQIIYRGKFAKVNY